MTDNVLPKDLHTTTRPSLQNNHLVGPHHQNANVAAKPSSEQSAVKMAQSHNAHTQPAEITVPSLTLVYVMAACILLLAGYGGLLFNAQPIRKWLSLFVMFGACALLFVGADSSMAHPDSSSGDRRALLCLLAGTSALVCGPAISACLNARCGFSTEHEINQLRAETAKEEARLDLYK